MARIMRTIEIGHARKARNGRTPSTALGATSHRITPTPANPASTLQFQHIRRAFFIDRHLRFVWNGSGSILRAVVGSPVCFALLSYRSS